MYQITNILRVIRKNHNKIEVYHLVNSTYYKGFCIQTDHNQLQNIFQHNFHH